MKFKLIIAIAVTIMISGIAFCLISTEDGKTSDNTNKMKKKYLPDSLDQYYENQTYLIGMYELGESMVGLQMYLGKVDSDNGYFDNATLKYFDKFSELYENSSKMVPEWKKYYDLKSVIKLGNALEGNDSEAIKIAMGKVSETCSECHLDTMTLVYNNYYWDDFRKVTIDTPDGPLPWKEAKMYYLLMGFDGIGVNIKENNHTGAQESFELFDQMFNNMTNNCSACHISEPRYFVSEDVRSMIDDMGEKINETDYNNATILRYGIGDNCHRCHIIHIPPQYAKVNWE